jgi:hypothetical protein
MEARYRPSDESEAAREGTAAHWYLSEALEGRFHSVGTLAPNGVPIDRDMQDGAQDLRIDVLDTLRAATPGCTLAIEQRVAAPRSLHRNVWGTPDVYLLDRQAGALHVWDYKYGHKPVSAYRNWQLIAYAACILEAHGISFGEFLTWRFTFTIHQPRCYRDGGPLDEWHTSGSQVGALISNLSAAADQASKPDALCTTGLQCQNCDAEIHCAANLAAGGAARDVSMAQLPVDMPASAVGLMLRLVQAAQARLKSQAAALEAHAQALIQSGEHVPFYEIGYVNSRERWTADDADVVALGELFGVEIATGVKLLTPPQARKAGIDAAVIQQYSEKPSGAAKLKPVDDTAASRAFGTDAPTSN